MRHHPNLINSYLTKNNQEAALKYITEVEKTIQDDDSQISPWAKNSVYITQVHGLIGGRPGNLYDPKSIATREEVAQIFLNYANA